jgi:hypothetical protein
MKSRKKMKFRIGVLCLIAMFMLIPLLSSPVAATLHFDNIGVRSNNSQYGGPLVVVVGGQYDPEGSYGRSCDGSGWITFTCDCYQIDNKPAPAGQGSVHYMELNVQKIEPNPVGSLMTTYMYRELNPGQQASPYPTQLQITCNYTIRTSSSIPTWHEKFAVYVYAEVTDNATQNSAWNTFYWDVTIN